VSRVHVVRQLRAIVDVRDGLMAQRVAWDNATVPTAVTHTEHSEWQITPPELLNS